MSRLSYATTLLAITVFSGLFCIAQAQTQASCTFHTFSLKSGPKDYGERRKRFRGFPQE